MTMRRNRGPGSHGAGHALVLLSASRSRRAGDRRPRGAESREEISEDRRAQWQCARALVSASSWSKPVNHASAIVAKFEPTFQC